MCPGKNDIAPFIRWLYSGQELTCEAAANGDYTFLLFGSAIGLESTNN